MKKSAVISRLFILTIIVLFVAISPAFSALISVSDSELDQITAQTFSTYTYEEYVNKKNEQCIKMQIDLNMKLEFRVKIDRLKMGYYNHSGKTGVDISGFPYDFANGDGPGWNIDIKGFQVGKYRDGLSSNIINDGNKDENYVMDGLTIRTDYVVKNGNKVLKTLAVGSDNCNGTAYADEFLSYSGVMMPDVGNLDVKFLGITFPGSKALARLLMNNLMKEWTYRTHVLNYNRIFLVASFDVSRNGMHFRPGTNTSGFYIVMDRDIGVGWYSGPKIADLNNKWPE